MKNILTVDLEDWFFFGEHFKRYKIAEWSALPSIIEDSVDIFLKLLDNCKISATFFVLGWVAEQKPEVVKKILDAGHNIASHGYSHLQITKATKEEFKLEIEKSLEILFKITKQQCKGFRAPIFSIVKETIWAVDVLKEYGFEYDSSVYPLKGHPDYGLTDYGNEIFSFDNGLIEVPMTVYDFHGIKIPCSGGGYFRFFPYFIFKYFVKQCNKLQKPLVFYIHPADINPDQPREKAGAINYFRHYYNIDSANIKFEKLLNDFEFVSVEDYLKNYLKK